MDLLVIGLICPFSFSDMLKVCVVPQLKNCSDALFSNMRVFVDNGVKICSHILMKHFLAGGLPVVFHSLGSHAPLISCPWVSYCGDMSRIVLIQHLWATLQPFVQQCEVWRKECCSLHRQNWTIGQCCREGGKPI